MKGRFIETGFMQRIPSIRGNLVRTGVCMAGRVQDGRENNGLALWARLS